MSGEKGATICKLCGTLAKFMLDHFEQKHEREFWDMMRNMKNVGTIGFMTTKKLPANLMGMLEDKILENYNVVDDDDIKKLTCLDCKTEEIIDGLTSDEMMKCYDDKHDLKVELKN